MLNFSHVPLLREEVLLPNHSPTLAVLLHLMLDLVLVLELLPIQAWFPNGVDLLHLGWDLTEQSMIVPELLSQYLDRGEDGRFFVCWLLYFPIAIDNELPSCKHDLLKALLLLSTEGLLCYLEGWLYWFLGGWSGHLHFPPDLLNVLGTCRSSLLLYLLPHYGYVLIIIGIIIEFYSIKHL